MKVGVTMDPLLGQIQLFAFGWPPQNWLPCEGQLLQITAYNALYALLGTMFGGNGSTTFGLPDLRNANLANGSKYCIAISGIFPQRY